MSILIPAPARIVAAAFVLAPLTVAPSHAQQVREGDVTTSDGVRVHYFDVGSDTGRTPVVMIHGYTANSEWKWIKSGIAQALAADRRVIAVDARETHGSSHFNPKYTEALARFVRESDARH